MTTEERELLEELAAFVVGNWSLGKAQTSAAGNVAAERVRLLRDRMWQQRSKADAEAK